MISSYHHAFYRVKTIGLALLSWRALSHNSRALITLMAISYKIIAYHKNPNDDAICVVYITGAVDAITTMDLIAEKTSGTAKQICLSDETSPDDLKAMTLSWLEEKQENLDFAATLLILGAVQNSYSCPQ